MTREITIKEQNNKLKHLITCMKCKVSGKSCDENCPTQYNAGNMGKIIKNLEEISKILEQESCEDTIGRQAAIDAFAPYAEYDSNRTNAEWVRRINIVLSALPSAQPERIKGHWIDIDKTHSKCDKCESVFEIASANGEINFCPNCGAEMESEE